MPTVNGCRCRIPIFMRPGAPQIHNSGQSSRATTSQLSSTPLQVAE